MTTVSENSVKIQYFQYVTSPIHNTLVANHSKHIVTYHTVKIQHNKNYNDISKNQVNHFWDTSHSKVTTHL